MKIKTLKNKLTRIIAKSMFEESRNMYKDAAADHADEGITESQYMRTNEYVEEWAEAEMADMAEKALIEYGRMVERKYGRK